MRSVTEFQSVDAECNGVESVGKRRSLMFVFNVVVQGRLEVGRPHVGREGGATLGPPH